MRIFVSVAATKPVDIATVNASVKRFFKKAKHFDSHHKNILYSCKSLAAHFAGRTDFKKSYETMSEIVAATKQATYDTTDHYDKIDPALLKIGLAAFKKMKEMILVTDVNGSNADKLDTIYRLSMVCGRILDTADPATSLEDFKKFKTLTETLREVGINF